MKTPGWGRTELEHYLRFDFWDCKTACHVLAGCFFTQKRYDFVTPEETARKKKILTKAAELLQLWLSRGNAAHLENHPPVYFIEWALSKNFRPDWLDWAIELGLYDLKQETENLLQAAPAVKVEAVTVTTPAPAPAPATQGNKLRKNSLDPVIDKAIKQAGCTALASVYLKLKELAIAEEKPFTGELDGDALRYTSDKNQPEKLTKEALGKRLKRR